jgi:hypothetical protein
VWKRFFFSLPSFCCDSGGEMGEDGLDRVEGKKSGAKETPKYVPHCSDEWTCLLLQFFFLVQSFVLCLVCPFSAC